MRKNIQKKTEGAAACGAGSHPHKGLLCLILGTVKLRDAEYGDLTGPLGDCDIDFMSGEFIVNPGLVG
ncbi:MAG: hypothetical protein KIC77_08240 [Clostridiales bacterium]|jgi:hypothetical protein|nr:hypothetical protein [Clostridiales bacterium]